MELTLTTLIMRMLHPEEGWRAPETSQINLPTESGTSLRRMIHMEYQIKKRLSTNKSLNIL